MSLAIRPTTDHPAEDYPNPTIRTRKSTSRPRNATLAPAPDSTLAHALTKLETAVRATLNDPSYVLANPTAGTPAMGIASPLHFRPGHDTDRDAQSFPCHVCGTEIGWNAPSSVCSTECLNAGQGFSTPTVPSSGPMRRAFDVTRDNGIITAFNRRTGNTVRFRINMETWGGKIVRVVSFDDGSKFVNFAFVDEFGVRPWGISAKTTVPMGLRPKYARFLENLGEAESKGIELTIVSME